MAQTTYIACAARRGGVGKTTVSLLLAAYLREQGKRVALVDLDPQASATVFMRQDAEHSSALGLLNGVYLPPSRVHGIDLYTSTVWLEEFMDQVKAHGNPPVLPPLRDSMPTDAYDYVVMDGPPGLKALDRHIADAADRILVLSEADTAGIAALNRLLGELQERVPSAQVALIFNRLDTRRRLDRSVGDLAPHFEGYPLFQVRTDAALKEAIADGRLPAPCCAAWACMAPIWEWITTGGSNHNG